MSLSSRSVGSGLGPQQAPQGQVGRGRQLCPTSPLNALTRAPSSPGLLFPLTSLSCSQGSSKLGGPQRMEDQACDHSGSWGPVSRGSAPHIASDRQSPQGSFPIPTGPVELCLSRHWTSRVPLRAPAPLAPLPLPLHSPAILYPVPQEFLLDSLPSHSAIWSLPLHKGYFIFLIL